MLKNIGIAAAVALVVIYAVAHVAFLRNLAGLPPKV